MPIEYGNEATRPKRVLYIAEFSTGGSVESLLTLVSGLDRAQYEPTVLFYTMPQDPVRNRFATAGVDIRWLYPRRTEAKNAEAAPQLPGYNLQARIRRWLGRPGEAVYESLKFAVYLVRFRYSLYRDLRRSIRDLSPDLVHLNNGVQTDVPGILAARRCRVPSVCHIRTLGRLTPLHVVAARSVRLFLCISHAVRDTACSYGLREARAVVVPNAVDMSRFHEPGANSKAIREEFGWSDQHRVFALVGRVVSWKGQDDFIDAIHGASKQDASIRGLIVGDGDGSASNDRYIETLHKKVRDAGLDEIIVFTGHRTDVPDLMRAADVAVCASSLPEPFGRVIIESMAAGTPVIATAAGGAIDIIDDGVDGILVPIRDSSEMGEAILRLARDPDAVLKLSEAGRRKVERQYTAGKHVANVCGLYDSLDD